MNETVSWKVPQNKEEILGWQKYLLDCQGDTEHLSKDELYCFAYFDDLVKEYEEKTGNPLLEEDQYDWYPDDLDCAAYHGSIDGKHALFVPEGWLKECGYEIDYPDHMKSHSGSWAEKTAKNDAVQERQ